MTIAELQKRFVSEIQTVYETGESNAIAQLVFTYYFDVSAAELWKKKETGVPDHAKEKLLAILERIKNKEPVQYILGETFFCDLKFKVNPAVLIPRPETEELVHWIIEEYNQGSGSKVENPEKSLRILDIGTGSGCIAISLKKNIPNSEVLAMDVSQQALLVAEENANLNHTEVNFIQHDILKTSEPAHPSFDIIVSNPPYISEEEKSTMHSNVLDYEPHVALFAGSDPLIFYKAISSFAKTNLKKGGSLFFEINEDKSGEIETILKAEGFTSIQLKKDITSRYRMISARWNS